MIDRQTCQGEPDEPDFIDDWLVSGDYCQGKSQQQETDDSMDMLCIAVCLVIIVLTLAGLAIF